MVFNEIEAGVIIVQGKMRHEKKDVNQWRCRMGFKHVFSTLETWLLLCENYAHCSWARGIWFSMATPKFAFITWLAMLDRLSTMDMVSKWSLGADTTCVLCKGAVETRNHLFFECTYSLQLWEHLTAGILRDTHSNVWSVIVLLIS